MLDLNHPQTKHIFEASRLCDLIRHELIALEKATGSAELIGRAEHVDFILIPQLCALNQKHFKNSTIIAAELEALKTAVNSQNFKLAWDSLISVEGGRENDNFGVWRI